jgi:hypothetical protein
MTCIELLIVLLTFILATCLGMVFSRCIGWWAMIPSYFIVAFLMRSFAKDLIHDIRAQLRTRKITHRLATAKVNATAKRSGKS